MTLVTSNYYSILFYNSGIWLILCLSRHSKQSVMSVSAAVLKICCNEYHNLMSFECLHKITGRPLQSAICTYNHALLLHKTYNDLNFTTDWLDINFNQQFNNRYNKVEFYDCSNCKQGIFWQTDSLLLMTTLNKAGSTKTTRHSKICAKIYL